MWVLAQNLHWIVRSLVCFSDWALALYLVSCFGAFFSVEWTSSWWPISLSWWDVVSYDLQMSIQSLKVRFAMVRFATSMKPTNNYIMRNITKKFKTIPSQHFHHTYKNTYKKSRTTKTLTTQPTNTCYQKTHPEPPLYTSYPKYTNLTCQVAP